MICSAGQVLIKIPWPYDLENKELDRFHAALLPNNYKEKHSWIRFKIWPIKRVNWWEFAFQVMNEEQTTLTDQPRSQFHLKQTQAIRPLDKYGDRLIQKD